MLTAILDQRARLRALGLGIWLSVVAVWPTKLLAVGHAHLFWQPVLVLGLGVLAVIRRRRYGWKAAVGQSLMLFSIFSIAGWLPALYTTSYWTDYPYPRLYGWYLYGYEAGLAACIGYLGMRAWLARATSWWSTGGWSAPAIAAPVLLVVRGFLIGHGISLLAGMVIGVSLAVVRSWRWVSGHASRRQLRLITCGVFLAGVLMTYGSGMRIYSQTGENFPSASDDGPGYYQMAVKVAEDPGVYWTAELNDKIVVTGYYPLMALWFMLVGPHIPSWLLWHGVAGGLLALCVFWLGRSLMGTAGGLAAAGLVIADRILQHPMATLNMEAFFIPMLYAALVLWIRVLESSPGRHGRLSFVAGVVLGVATVFRPTSMLLPFVVILLACWERPRQPWRQLRVQGAWMLTGFSLPMALHALRHRIAWGYWTVSGEKARTAHLLSDAFWVQGEHSAEIGLGAWLRLVAQDPSVIWTSILPKIWEQVLFFWSHTGFGQMDLLQGLNHAGPYQGVLMSILIAWLVVGMVMLLRRRSRRDLIVLALPVYFSALAMGFVVLNSRYRSPCIPAIYLMCCVGIQATAGSIRSAVGALGTAKVGESA